jgi:ribosomal protein S18 acetylase RimI-like enzyme
VTTYRPYVPADLDHVLALSSAQGWTSLPKDPVRAQRVLTNPGVTTFVAVDGDDIVGFVYLLSDGEIQAYVCSIAVAASHRRRGIGTELLAAAFAVCGAERADLLSEADEFYEAMPHRKMPGFRVYPRYEALS